MRNFAQCRGGTMPGSVNHDPFFILSDVRIYATIFPEMLPAASAWARVHHPRTTLARSA